MHPLAKRKNSRHTLTGQIVVLSSRHTVLSDRNA